MIRIVTWMFFGPWVKLLDICWIHKYYRTKEELFRDGIPDDIEDMQQDIANRPNIFYPILESTWVEAMALSGRVVAEDTIKLRDFREERYGAWSEAVPFIDTCRFPSVPQASSSYAQPLAPCQEKAQPGDWIDLPQDQQRWEYVAGQKLEGPMIPQPIVRALVSSATNTKRVDDTSRDGH